MRKEIFVAGPVLISHELRKALLEVCMYVCTRFPSSRDAHVSLFPLHCQFHLLLFILPSRTPDFSILCEQRRDGEGVLPWRCWLRTRDLTIDGSEPFAGVGHGAEWRAIEDIGLRLRLVRATARGWGEFGAGQAVGSTPCLFQSRRRQVAAIVAGNGGPEM